MMKPVRILAVTLSFLVLVAMLAGCAERPKEPLSITIEPTSATMKVEEPKEFTVTIKSHGWEDWEGNVREGWEGNVWDDLHYFPVSSERMYNMGLPHPLEEWMTEDEEGFPVMKPLILEKGGKVSFTLFLSFVEPSDDVWFRLDIRVRLSETEAITVKSNQVDITVTPTPTPTPAPTPAPAPSPGTFPDENLEAAIRDALGKAAGEEITAAELGELTFLAAFERGIADLSGLEYCSSLTQLSLRYNRLSDISALSSLTNLTQLELGVNQVSDISPLASLTKLVSLHLQGNQISDISPLASLTNLIELWLNGNQISDISALSSLTNLALLELGENQVSDISPLTSLTNLSWLELEGNPLSTTSVNVYIPQLKERGVVVHYDAPAPVEPTPVEPAPAPETVTITGTVLYDGRPVVEQTSAAANFWCRDENTGKAFPIDATYDSTTGTYAISNVPPGKYGISVKFDLTPSFNGRIVFPGDLDGWNTVVVPEAQATVQHNLAVQKNIHLTSPVDNQKEIGTIGDPKDTYALGQLLFVWEPIPEATYYTVWIDVYQETPYKWLSNALKTSVSTPEFQPPLPLSQENQSYQFRLEARNVDGLLVGKLIVPYTNGHGWDYRFRIVGPVPSPVVTLISPEEGAVLDNGRTDGQDSIVWHFEWSPVEGATQYHLYVILPTAKYPVIDEYVASTSYDHIREGSYIIEKNRHGWTWKVRAKVDDQWGPWAQRTFDVEPVNSDPPRP